MNNHSSPRVRLQAAEAHRDFGPGRHPFDWLDKENDVRVRSVLVRDLKEMDSLGMWGLFRNISPNDVVWARMPRGLTGLLLALTDEYDPTAVEILRRLQTSKDAALR